MYQCDRSLYDTLGPNKHGRRANGGDAMFVFLFLANFYIHHYFNSSINNISVEAVKTCKLERQWCRLTQDIKFLLLQNIDEIQVILSTIKEQHQMTV